MFESADDAAEDGRIEGIEELDGAGRTVAPRPPRTLRWELLLGLLVLLLVGGFGIADWLHQQALNDIYHLGSVAEERDDWETAAAEFHRAGDFRDAADRAAKAETRIRQRDTQFANAVAAYGRGDWASAYTAYSAVEKIQPGYNKSDHWRDDSLCRLKLNGLEGLVYRQERYDAGLYIYNAGRKMLLAGSDGASKLYAAGFGMLVYDGPADNPAQRRLLLAVGVGPGTVVHDAGACSGAVALGITGWQVTPLPDTLAPDGVVTMSSNGFWWVGQRTNEVGRTVPSWAYYSKKTHSVAPIILNGINWEIMGADPVSEVLITVQFLGVAGGLDTQTVLYLSGPDGSNRQQTLVTPGYIRSATPSQDGGSVLYTVEQGLLGDPGNAIQVLLKNLSSPLGPKVVAQVLNIGLDRQLLAGDFMPTNPHRILIEFNGNLSESLINYDTASASGVNMWAGQRKTVVDRPYFFSADGNYLVFQSWSSSGSSLVVQPLDGSAAREQPLNVDSLGDSDVLRDVRFVGRRVLYSVSSHNSTRGLDRIYSLDLSAASASPRLIYQQDYSMADGQRLAQTALPDAGLLMAYIFSYRLLAATPGGDLSVELGTDVNAVWSTDNPDRVLRLR